MARIAGVDLPRTKRIEVGLTYIFGIGPMRSTNVLQAAGVSADTRVKDLTEDEVRSISRVIEEQGGVEGDLRKEISINRATLAFETGEIARQASGAVMMHYGETSVLVAATAAIGSPL